MQSVLPKASHSKGHCWCHWSSLISGLYQSPLIAWKSIGHSLGSQKRTLKGTGCDSGPFPHGVFKKIVCNNCDAARCQDMSRLHNRHVGQALWLDGPRSPPLNVRRKRWMSNGGTKPRRDRFPSSLASFVQRYNWKPIGSHSSHSNTVMLAQVWQAHCPFS